MIDQNKVIHFHLFLALIIAIFIPLYHAVPPNYIASERYISTGVFQISTGPFYNAVANYLGNYVVNIGPYTKTNTRYQVGLTIHSLDFYFEVQRLALDMRITSKTTTSFNLQFSSPMANKLQLLKVCYITKDFSYTDPFYIFNFRSPTLTQNINLVNGSPVHIQHQLPVGITAPVSVKQVSFLHGFDAYAQNSVPNIDYDLFLKTTFPSSTEVDFRFSTDYDDVKLDFYSITLVFYSNVDLSGVTASLLSRFTDGIVKSNTTLSLLTYSTPIGGQSMTSSTLFVGMKSFHVNDIGPTVDWINFETILTSPIKLDFISNNQLFNNYLRFQFIIVQSWQCASGFHMLQSTGNCMNTCPSSLLPDPTNTMCIKICPSYITNCIKCKLQGGSTICWKCQYGYSYDTGASNCQSVCGDGILLSGIEQCDDGNINAGDGCDPTCIIEPTYKCIVDSITGFMAQSICFVPDPLFFTLSYQYSIKQPSSNQLYMYFTIQPSDQTYSQYYQSISWNSAISSNLTTSTYSYQYIHTPIPHLKLTMTYTQNLNNKNIQFQIQPYSQSLYPSEYHQVIMMTLNVNNLQAVNNMDINVYDESMFEFMKVVNGIAWILAAVYMIMFVAGIVIGKVYILQMSVAPQLAYLSLISLTTPPPTFYSLTPLKHIFIYSYTPSPYISSFSFYQQSPSTSPQHNFMQLSPYFIQNYNIMFIPIVLSLSVYLYLYLKYRKVDFATRRKRVQVDRTKIFFFNDLPMYFVLWFAFLVIVAGQVQFQYLGLDLFNNAVKYLGIVFVIVNILLICAYFYLFLDQYLRFTTFQQLFSTIRLFIPFRQRNIKQHFYYLIYIQKLILSIIIVQVPGSSLMNLFISIQNIIIIILLIIFRPYRNYQLLSQTQNTIDERNMNIRQIFNYFICCVIQIMFLITNILQFNMENLWLLYFPIIIQVLLIGQIGITIYFLIKDGRIIKDLQDFKVLIQNTDDKIEEYVDFGSTTKRQQINQTKEDIIKKQQKKILQKHLNEDLQEHIRKIQSNQIQDNKQINILDLIIQNNKKINLTPLQLQNLSTNSKKNSNDGNQNSFFKSFIKDQDPKKNTSNNFDTNNNDSESLNHSNIIDNTKNHNTNNLSSNNLQTNKDFKKNLNKNLNSNHNSDKTDNSRYDSQQQQSNKSIRHKQILKSLKTHLVTVDNQWLNYEKVNSHRFKALQSTLMHKK